MKVAKNDLEAKVLLDIERYGIHIVQVIEDEEHPTFSYSIGLFKNYSHPEVIIIGLKPELSKVLLNNMAFDIKNGKKFEISKFNAGVLDDFDCYFSEVPNAKYPDYVGWALWFYDGQHFPLAQCVPPTVEGKFPWDDEFPEDVSFYLKVLGKTPS